MCSEGWGILSNLVVLFEAYDVRLSGREVHEGSKVCVFGVEVGTGYLGSS